jgi:hypothetical protein
MTVLALLFDGIRGERGVRVARYLSDAGSGPSISMAVIPLAHIQVTTNFCPSHNQFLSSLSFSR